MRSLLANPAIAGLIRDGDELIEAQRETWDQIQALREARAGATGVDIDAKRLPRLQAADLLL